MPKVSVLTTVFNREKYLEACIESVLQSTFQDWELIIVDDQSRDNSVEIAQSYAENDSRIHLHVNPINLGDYPNRNYAASLAKGKYIKFLDADDLIYPNGLEVMVKTMEEYPNAKFHVEGHTDSTGSEETNLRLSEGRAAAVKDYLVAGGVDEFRLSSKGYGEANPIADNKTSAGRKQNRRVEIKVVNPDN